ncbi:MAG TPA: ATP-binding protein [Ktedonobacteraceae bacterium]|nr:ATP-binding protein [Ktedonobacteraceae bacterium]
MTELLIERTSLLTFLQERLLPAVIASRASATEPLRLWSIGCQEGDEASTLALLVQSQFPADSATRAFTLFATDPDPAAISRARHFRYPAYLLARLPSTALPWLQADPEMYQLHFTLRQRILFGSRDLLSQAPFPHLDLILCHNLPADFTPAQQQTVYNRLAYALAPHGYLLLLSPAVQPLDALYYQRLEAAWPLYQRTTRAVTFHALGWSKTKESQGFPPLPSVPEREDDEIRDTYMEELHSTLEDREMVYQEVNLRLQELERLYQSLEQMYQIKEDFLAMMSHEIRTPLMILLTTTQLLQREMTRSPQQEAAQSDQAFQKRLISDLQVIEQQGQNISRLLSDLLESAQLQADLFYVSAYPIDLVKLVRKVIVQHELGSNQRIRLVCALETIIGIGDEARLEQVVHNLLSNALKYSEAPGEVVVTLGMQFSDGQAGEVLLSVQDQGQGISQEDLPHLFERFYRAGKNGDAPGGRASLGLGLYISAEIVKRHGGRIWAESQPGRGSTFFVCLPLKQPVRSLRQMPPMS